MRLVRDRHHASLWMLVGTALTGMLLLSTASFAAMSGEEEVQLIATPGENVWEPRVVMIDQGQTYGGIEVLLENPTDVKHGFMAPGIFELVAERTTEKAGNGGQFDIETMRHTTKPLAITLEPGETKRITISTENLRGTDALGRQFRYFCPIHEDVVSGGSIHVLG